MGSMDRDAAERQLVSEGFSPTYAIDEYTRPPIVPAPRTKLFVSLLVLTRL